MFAPSLRLTLCVIASSIMHGAIWMLWSVPEPQQVMALDKDHFAISVGMQSAIAGAVAQTQQTPQNANRSSETLAPRDTPPVKKQVVAQTKQVVSKTADSVPTKQKTTPKPKPVKTEPKREKTPIPPAKTAESTKTPPKKQQAKPVPKRAKKHPQVEKVVKKPVKSTPKKRPQVASQAQTAGKAGKNGSSQNKPRVQETGTGDQAASASNSNRFDFAVRQHLLKHKKTPRVLNPRRKRGTVTLQFVLDRQGHVLDYTIKKSAHVRAFDRAALRLLKQAEPFPTPPSDVHWKNRRYRMDIDYRIH